MILTGETDKIGEKPVPVPLCPQIPESVPGANPGLYGERPATNRLSHVTDIQELAALLIKESCSREFESRQEHYPQKNYEARPVS
jgi:hypothetical protein